MSRRAIGRECSKRDGSVEVGVGGRAERRVCKTCCAAGSPW